MFSEKLGIHAGFKGTAAVVGGGKLWRLRLVRRSLQRHNAVEKI